MTTRAAVYASMPGAAGHGSLLLVYASGVRSTRACDILAATPRSATGLDSTLHALQG